MSGEDVARARIALKEEIDRTNSLVAKLQFQEAEENLPKVEELYDKLATIIDPNSQIHKTIMLHNKMLIEISCQNIENGLQRREAGKKEDGNIAFKCNWNDKNYKGV